MMMMMVITPLCNNKKRRHVENESRRFLNRLVWVRGIVWEKCEFHGCFLLMPKRAKKQRKRKSPYGSVMLTRYLSNSLALAEARLILAKLIWNFDFELDGDHESWVDDARFYVRSASTIYTSVCYMYELIILTSHQVLWELQPLKLRITPVVR